MHKREIEDLIILQNSFFLSNATKPISFRIEQLKKLRRIIKDNEEQILEALYADLGQPSFDAYFSEIYLSIYEINYVLKHLDSWAKRKRVKTPWYMWPVQSALVPEPYGVVLVIGTWNYPFNLILMPLIGAIAAGNCVIIKPSYKASACQNVLVKLINEHFPSDYLYAVKGHADILDELLNHKFNYIFFTGNIDFAKKVMHKAAEYITPVTLELGGKSPCIVDETASLDMAAKKIVWAKWLNAGQTCVAPDYLLVHKTVKADLIAKIKLYIKKYYGSFPEKSLNYARIITKERVQRLQLLIQHATIIFGGECDIDNRYFAPTLVEVQRMDDPLMQEEIFGPILPIISCDSLHDMLQIIHQHPTPLAVYMFSHNKQAQDTIMCNTISGSFGINELMLQVSSVYLPFGGIGASGMGRYHGKASFDTFSYYRSIIKSGPFESSLRYPWHSRLRYLLKKALNYFS